MCERNRFVASCRLLTGDSVLNPGMSQTGNLTSDLLVCRPALFFFALLGGC